MENKYRYDTVDNILGITNAANPTALKVEYLISTRVNLI
ncbi:hypothetical protein HMPREF1173_00681 [Prevotella nigrescens CC14M]|jgi:hypothetical protein|uniref:YD repeat (Two copies) n=1 Tax=Prevotella nigrescens CC14M TaxID=1073366 RepID=V8CPK8_9BACT|nr:hypothetical protein HMPREF1173_00681 [Prevotella nigrescens CC14M]